MCMNIEINVCKFIWVNTGHEIRKSSILRGYLVYLVSTYACLKSRRKNSYYAFYVIVSDF